MHNALHALCPFALQECPSILMTFLLMPFIKMHFWKCPFGIALSLKCPFGNALSLKCPFGNALYYDVIFQIFLCNALSQFALYQIDI